MPAATQWFRLAADVGRPVASAPRLMLATDVQHRAIMAGEVTDEANRLGERTAILRAFDGNPKNAVAGRRPRWAKLALIANGEQHSRLESLYRKFAAPIR